MSLKVLVIHSNSANFNVFNVIIFQNIEYPIVHGLMWIIINSNNFYDIITLKQSKVSLLNILLKLLCHQS